MHDLFHYYHYYVGAVSFTSHPSNQTIMEGQSARFECRFEGANTVPYWKVNTTVYYFTDIPRRYGYNYQDFSLNIQSTPKTLNFTSFQCIVGTAFSNRAYLIVFANETNTLENIIVELHNESYSTVTTESVFTMDRFQNVTTSIGMLALFHTKLA